MLGAVYDNSLIANSAASHAAYNIQALYGEEYAGRLCAASETAFREYFNKNLPKKAISKTVAPYAITVAFTKFIIPEDFKTIHNMSLIYAMDEVSSTAYDAFLSLKYNNDFSFSSLNDLRLSAIMALVASRHAYSSIWDGNHEKISKIDTILAKLYLAANSVDCDSVDYYAEKCSELNNLVSYLTDRELYIEDYLGMTVNEFADIWGNDYEFFYHMDAGIALYYEDDRLPFGVTVNFRFHSKDEYNRFMHDINEEKFYLSGNELITNISSKYSSEPLLMTQGQLTPHETLDNITAVLGEGSHFIGPQSPATQGYTFEKNGFFYEFIWDAEMDENTYQWLKPDMINTKSVGCAISLGYDKYPYLYNNEAQE